MKILANNVYSLDGRYYVALNITAHDIQLGTNADAPGMYLFCGAWYTKRLVNDIRTYGKIVPLTSTNHHQLKYKCKIRSRFIIKRYNI